MVFFFFIARQCSLSFVLAAPKKLMTWFDFLVILKSLC
jgi:hypothetical protein